MSEIPCPDSTREFLDHFRVREGDKSYVRVKYDEDSVIELCGFSIAKGTPDTVKPVLEDYFKDVAQRDKRFSKEDGPVDLSGLCTYEDVQGEILVRPHGELGQAFLDYVIDSLRGYGMVTIESSEYVPMTPTIWYGEGYI